MNKVVKFGTVFLGAVLVTNVLAQQRAAALNYGDRVAIVQINEQVSVHQDHADYVTFITRDDGRLLPEQVSCDEDQLTRLNEFLTDGLKGVTPVNPAIVCYVVPAP
jgi:hypothetical protein